MRKPVASIIASLILSSFLCFVAPYPGNAGTDSELFKKGVASFQKNRFQDAIESLSTLLRTNPKTPLRDMTLYYLARSHLKSGRSDRAATVTAQLMREFPTSYNKGTIDAELLRTLEPGAPPHAPSPQPTQQKAPETIASAPKVATKVAPDKATSRNALSGSREATAPRPSRPQAAPVQKLMVKVPDRLPKVAPRPVQAASRQGRAGTVQTLQRVSAESPERTSDTSATLPVVGTMTAQEYESISGRGTPPVLMELPSEWITATAGSTVSISFTISSNAAEKLKLTLSSHFPPFFKSRFTTPEGKDTGGEIIVEPGSTYHGTLTLSIPPASVDGARFSYPIEARFPPEGFSSSREVGIIASAPLVRAVVKAKTADSATGRVACTVTLLNAGSATAEDLSLRLVYDPSFEPLEIDSFARENGALVRSGVRLEPGGLVEFVTGFRMNGTEGSGAIDFRIDLLDRRLGTGASVRSTLAENAKQD